jgi:hypothetical protein
VTENDRTVADFSFSGRVWGLYQPLFYGFIGLQSAARSIDAFRTHHSAQGVLNGAVTVGLAIYVGWMFRAVRFTCVDGTLLVSQRRGKTVNCGVAGVRRLEITSRRSSALIDGSGHPVLEIDWRLMTRGDLQRLAAKLGIPYRTYTDLHLDHVPAPRDPLIENPPTA